MADDCIGYKSSTDKRASRSSSMSDDVGDPIGPNRICNGPFESGQSFKLGQKIAESAQSIGIDLGTTFSSVAYLDSDGRPEAIRSEEGELTTPSVVYFDNDQTLVGQQARRSAEFDPSRMVRFAKRHLGQRFLPKLVEERSISPVILQALLLKHLKQEAEKKLGPVSSAAITVPAYFNEIKRSVTRDAGFLAGFQSVEILNEPTAAAIAYGWQSRDGNIGKNNSESSLGANHCDRELVLVYDLGGGTFDATIMEIDDTKFDAISTAGDSYLGGIDWDRRLTDFLADQFYQQNGIDLRENDSAMIRLNLQAEQIKKSIGTLDVVKTRLGVPGNELLLEVTRSDFERLTRDLLDRTIKTCQNLLNDTGLEWADLNRIILVGGSTRMPIVREALQAESGLSIDSSLSPDESVAKGAAIYAHSLESNSTRLTRKNRASNNSFVRINNINSHDLGVLGVDRQTGKSRRQLMIARNSTLPAANSKQFLTAREGQRSVIIHVVEGGFSKGATSTHIGKCVVSGLPKNLPQGTCVLVTFRYTVEGMLHIDATLPDVDVHASTSIDRVNGLKESEFEYWQGELNRGIGLGSFETCSDRNIWPSVSSTTDIEQSRRQPLEDSVVSELDELLDRVGDAVAISPTQSEIDSELSRPEENGIPGQASMNEDSCSDPDLLSFLRRINSTTKLQ